MQIAQNASAVANGKSSRRPVLRVASAEPSPAIVSGRTWPWLLLSAAVLIACTLAAFSVDFSVAQWLRPGQGQPGHGPRYLHDLANISELFGRGECVLLVVILMWRLDRSRPWAIPGMATTALLSGLAADGVKMLISRARPHHFDLLGNVWSSFGPWFPLASMGSPNQSFPSAHTATAVGLAISLMVLYPAARGLFCLAPLLVAYQRMDCGAHFLSDVLCGAAVGCLVAAFTLRAGWLDREYCQLFWGRVGTAITRPRPEAKTSRRDARNAGWDKLA
jgi:membrane-associated phospholipid phosphatase